MYPRPLFDIVDTYTFLRRLLEATTGQMWYALSYNVAAKGPSETR